MTQDPKDMLALARHVARGCRKATLAATARPGTPEAGAAYASLVEVAFGPDCAPLLLISTLAEHTKNLLVEPRCSLLFDGTEGYGETLTGPRVSVQGTAVRLQPDTPAHDAAAARYLARFAQAQMYAGFADFSFWRVAPTRAHLVAGFGRIVWFENFALDADPMRDLAAGEAQIVAHMNADHSDAIELYASVLAARSGGGWRMTGVDPEGFDLRRAATGETARLAFDMPVADPEAARVELVRLVKRARTQQSDTAG